MEDESTSCQPDLKGEKSHKNKRYDVIKKKPPSPEKKFSYSWGTLYQYQKIEKTVKKVRRDQRIYKKLRSTSRFEKKVVINDSSSSDDTFTPDEYTFHSPYANCSCCNDNFGEEMYECCDCHRKYHDSCHIPIIHPRSEKRKKMFWCTMCEDMNTISKDLGKDGDPENISVGTVGRKIAERLLMELYCHIDGSDIFRERPNKNVFPEYYKCIVRAVALNDVRDSMISNTNYKLSDVVEDIKQVFVNAMLFYELGDPYFNLARRLLTHLHILFQSWIAPLTRNKQRTE